MRKIQISSLLLLAALVSVAQNNRDIHFRLNLVGYLPYDPKVAIVFSNQILKGDFNVIDLKSDNTVFTGRLVKSVVDGFAPFKNFYIIDFTKLKQSGSYFIELVQSKARSQKFNICLDCYQITPDLLIGFMQQQRCGYNPYFDEVCHQKDGRVMGGILKDQHTWMCAVGGTMQVISSSI